MFLPSPRVKLSIVGSLRDRDVACSASISNPVSGGQCHLIHLIILKRFSWPSLAYMCTKVAQSPIHFIFCTTTARLLPLISQLTQNICTIFVQRRPNVGQILYKCYSNVFSELCTTPQNHQTLLAIL